MPRILVGADIGKASRYAVGVDANGETVHRRAIENDEAGVNDPARWAVEHEAALVVGRPGGAAALPLRLCWSAGVAVGYVHGTAIVRARLLHGEGETDPKDAFVLADVARAHPCRIVWLEPTDETQARPEPPCGHDADLRADANRLTNRLRALLGTHWPALEQAFGERLDTRPVLALSAKYPSGPALARAVDKRIAARLEAGRPGALTAGQVIVGLALARIPAERSPHALIDDTQARKTGEEVAQASRGSPRHRCTTTRCCRRPQAISRLRVRPGHAGPLTAVAHGRRAWLRAALAIPAFCRGRARRQ